MNTVLIPIYFKKKMIINPLPNHRISQPKKTKYGTVVKTLF
jgi:hypothetical protein